ncbi:MAG TPA: hypothetical protein VLX61_01425 [Anaerolineales bacterium]|nr:hypothetical protein [Anaerolineales bacterium]
MLPIQIRSITHVADTPSTNASTSQATVMVAGYFYAVNLSDSAHPRHHHVAIHGECTCGLGRSCPAVQAVKDYLAQGGPRAERPPYGYYPVRPASCPVCGAQTLYEPSLSSRVRGAGWTCIQGGKSHYWQHRAHIGVMRNRLAQKRKFV